MSVVSGTSNSRVKDAVQLCLPIRRTPSMMNPPERNRKYDEMMEGISESWQLLQRELHKRADTPTSGTCLGDEQAEGSPRSTKKNMTVHTIFGSGTTFCAENFATRPIPHRKRPEKSISKPMPPRPDRVAGNSSYPTKQGRRLMSILALKACCALALKACCSQEFVPARSRRSSQWC